MIAKTTLSAPLPGLKQFEGTYRFSLDQYHAMIDHRILTTDDRVELLQGYVLYILDRATVPPASRFFPQWRDLRRWTLDEYHRMVEVGILTPEDKVELLDGHVVFKMPQNVPHQSSVIRIQTRLPKYLPPGWFVMSQCPLVVGKNEPEPDGAVLRGEDADYDRRHPESADCGLVIEVSASSLQIDRRLKSSYYAGLSIPTYWLINVEDRQIEVYTGPQPDADPPAYAARTDYRPGDAVPLAFDGTPAGSVPVAALLP